MNRDNPKLRIVYHDEFIPKDYLPTFSTLVIETFYFRIKDLSNQFIVCNDDFYFINPIPNDWFFKDGKIHQGMSGTRPRKWGNGNSVWSGIIYNNTRFLEKNILKTQLGQYYHYSHLPDGRVKSYEIHFMDKYGDEVRDAMIVSHFRHPKNLIPSLLFIDSMKYTKYGVRDEQIYKNSKYAELTVNTDWKGLRNKQMICLNDTVNSNADFENTQKKFLEFMESVLPEKSSFEK